jgi:hypothetical protein
MNMGETIGLCGFLGLTALIFLRLMSVERESAVLRAEIKARQTARQERRRRLGAARSHAEHIRSVSDVELVDGD